MHFFFYNIFNNFFKLKLLVFFKRKNMFFHKRDDLRRITYKKVIYRPKNKYKFKGVKQKVSKMINNNSRFLSTIISNRRVIKLIFFKKHTKQKNITKFLTGVAGKNNHFMNRASNFLFFILIQSHFFFFINDLNYFLAKKFIYVNNRNVSNKFFELGVNDNIKLITFNSYFDYISSVYKFFNKKKSKIKYKQWRSYKSRTGSFSFAKRWLPNFLDKFLFYKMDIPKYLEVDFFTLTIVYLYSDKNAIYKNKFLLRFVSFYLLKMYNWKKLN